MDQLPAPRVDEHHARLHLRDRYVTDHVTGRIVQRTVQRDDIRTGIEFVERHIVEPLGCGKSRIGTGVVGQHPHPEPQKDADQAARDPSRADDAGRLAPKVVAQQSVERKIPVARPPVGTVDLAVERQQQSHGMLRHGMRRIGRNAHDRNREACGGTQIDIVETGATQGDQPDSQIGQTRNRRRIGFVVHKDADRLRALGQHRTVGIQMALVVDHSEPVITPDPIKRLLIVGLCPEHRYFHTLTCYLF